MQPTTTKIELIKEALSLYRKVVLLKESRTLTTPEQRAFAHIFKESAATHVLIRALLAAQQG